MERPNNTPPGVLLFGPRFRPGHSISQPGAACPSLARVHTIAHWRLLSNMCVSDSPRRTGRARRATAPAPAATSPLPPAAHVCHLLPSKWSGLALLFFSTGRIAVGVLHCAICRLAPGASVSTWQILHPLIVSTCSLQFHVCHQLHHFSCHWSPELLFV